MRVWAHAQISRQLQLEIVRACILSRLTYGLAAVCLYTASLRRLDGFHCRCLRAMLCIPAAYYSSVSNATVFGRAGQTPVSEEVLRQQMVFMAGLARRPADDPVRQSIFEPTGVTLRPLPDKRRVGRPRLGWAPTVMQACVEAAGSEEALQSFFNRMNASDKAWRQHLSAHT